MKAQFLKKIKKGIRGCGDTLPSYVTAKSQWAFNVVKYLWRTKYQNELKRCLTLWFGSNTLNKTLTSGKCFHDLQLPIRHLNLTRCTFREKACTHHEPRFSNRRLSVRYTEEDGDSALDLVHVGHSGPIEFRDAWSIVEVNEEAVDSAVVCVHRYVTPEVFTSGPALALKCH